MAKTNVTKRKEMALVYRKMERGIIEKLERAMGDIVQSVYTEVTEALLPGFLSSTAVLLPAMGGGTWNTV